MFQPSCLHYENVFRQVLRFVYVIIKLKLMEKFEKDKRNKYRPGRIFMIFMPTPAEGRSGAYSVPP